jgi:hypothetical protein
MVAVGPDGIAFEGSSVGVELLVDVSELLFEFACLVDEPYPIAPNMIILHILLQNPL